MEIHIKDQNSDVFDNAVIDISDFSFVRKTILKDFTSNEIENFDQSVTFPPTKYKTFRINKNEEIKKVRGSKYFNNILVEYVDLKEVSENLLKKIRNIIPTKEVQLIKNESEGSNSEYSEDNSSSDIETNFNGINANVIYEIDELELEENYQISKREKPTNELIYNNNPSHFFSLTFNSYSHDLRNEFIAFKKTIMDSVDYASEISSSYFINENKLHITLGLVRINDESDFFNCKNSLIKLKETEEFSELVKLSSKDKGFPLTIQGLSCFGSPTSSKVVFGKLQEKNKIILLKRLWCKLCEICIENKVNVTINDDSYSQNSNKKQENNHTTVTDKQAQKLIEKLKFGFNPHVTFINTKYGFNNTNKRKTFDSSKLQQVFSNKRFGTGYISKIELNELTNYSNNFNDKIVLNDCDSANSNTSNNRYKSIISLDLK